MPAENAAITEGGHPREITERNIAAIRAQMRRLGYAIDWRREVSAHEVEYYRWTQWLFLKFFERGLAYRAAAPVNWCPNDQTVVAHEYVVDGRCDRCGTLVEARNLEQWFFRITAYAEELLQYDVPEWGDWPERTKTIQRNWIGRSEGAEVLFRIEELDVDVPVFTTRPDTLFGATFFVLAPEHPFVERLATDEVRDYVKRTAARRGEERAAEETKTGVFTGHYATNPVNGERVPIFVADYVLMEYGTGAIMAVPAHDERDYEFAREFDLPVRPVVVPRDGDVPEEGAFSEHTEGEVLVNSGEFSGLTSPDAKAAIMAWLQERGSGSPTVSYRLRDWSFSRQRYWGCPIPVVHCDECGIVPVPESELPVLLPEVDDYRPRGVPPLASNHEWLYVPCPALRRGGEARGRHDGYVRRLLLVLPALRRPAERRGAVRPSARRLLVPGLPVHRRDRPRDRAPALLALLRQGHARDGAGRLRRAVRARVPPGLGADGRLEDVEVARERRGAGRAGRGVRRRRGAPLHPFHGAGRPGHGVDGHAASRESSASCAGSGASSARWPDGRSSGGADTPLARKAHADASPGSPTTSSAASSSTRRSRP